tara:strand:- start:392 stop:1825 length:1434 start_codon:yes stop_codon:yes gene_type:complete
MGGGGGDTATTNVTNTGLGDDQYQGLADNQVGISGQIDTARDDASIRYDNFDNRFDTLDTSFTGVGDNLTSGFTNIQDLLSQYNTGMNTQFDSVNTGVGANNTAIAGNATALGGLQTDLTGGFDQMGGRFDTVDTNTGNIQGAVDQGFIDQAQGFTDAQTDRTAQFDASNAAMNTGFADAGTALDTGFGEASTQLTNTQANVLGGQGNIGTTLDTMQGTADTYAAQTLENQGALQQGQDGFVTSFDNYTERYGDDQELAQQSRADLATAQANQTDRLREDMGEYAQAAATGQSNISGELSDVATGLGTAVEGGFMDADAAIRQTGQTTTDNINRSIESSANNTDALMENLDAGQITAARDMARVAAAQGELDVGMRQEFNQLGQAFDDNGALIKSSIDAQGNTITRSMDDQGNLMLRSFDVTGQSIGDQVINVQNSLQQLNSLQTKRGANVSMGNLSPAMTGATAQSGFASPFTTTG